MKRFFITGISGVGKSSVAEKLSQRGIPSIDIDSVKGLCQWINKDTFKVERWHHGMTNKWYKNHKYICDKEETFLKRIDERASHDFGKHILDKQNILSWYKNFEEKMLGKGAIAINTEGSLDKVVEKVVKH